MAKYRQDRINEAVVNAMADILRQIKDPRVTSSMVTITAAEVTADLKFAKIYFSSYGGDVKEIKKGLTSAAGFIRRELAHTLNMRITPELTFINDTSIEYGASISKVLKSIEISAPDNEYDDYSENSENDGDKEND